MTLRARVILFVAVTILAFSGVLLMASYFVLMRSYNRLEEESVRRNVARVSNAIDYRLQGLDSRAEDWATWDDTYAFVQDGNLEYIRSNLIGSLTYLEVNLMAIVNPAGETVLARAFDLDNDEETKLAPGMLQLLSDKSLLAGADPEAAQGGMVLLPEGPLQFVSRPVLTSAGDGPARGRFVLGRYMDSAYAAELSEITELAVSFHGVAGGNVVGAPGITAGSLLESTLVRPLDNSRVAGYSLFADSHGEPVLVAGIELPRDIYSQGRSTILLLFAGIGLLAVVVILLNIGLFERLVLGRLRRLSNSVALIAAPGGASLRVPVEGRDELSALAGEINGMLGKLVQSETLLRESEKKYSIMVENSNDGIVVVGNGVTVYANPRLLEIAGLSYEEVINQPFIKHISPECRNAVMENYVARTAGLPVPERYEIEILHKDGCRIPVEISGKAIEFHGKPCDMVVVRDITEEKRALEYEELDKIKTNLLSTVSHELRTPLATIKGYSTLLLDYDKRLVRAEKRQYLDSISKATDRLTEMVSRLLDMSRLDAGIFRLDKQPEEIGHLVCEKVSEARVRAPDHRIVARLDENLPDIRADGKRVHQVLDNLLENAIRYSGKGTEIVVKVTATGGDLQVSVSDRGAGIPASEIEKLFDRRYRLEMMLAQDATGMGLGLPLCKALVEAHGGRIWIESVVGIGTTVSFTLPLSEERTREH